MVRSNLQTCASPAAALLLAPLLLLAGATRPVAAHPVSWDVYYSRVAGSDNLKRTAFRFDGERVTLGPRRIVAAIEGADGPIFAPDGDLLVGGQGDRVHKVRTDGSGEFVTAGPAAQ